MTQETKSKSQRKRDHQFLVGLAKSLVGLTGNQLEQVPLEEGVRAAVADARGMARGALQRQLRYLARLLADQEPAPIREAVAACQGTGRQATARFRRIERWRERLLTEGDPALEALLEAFPQADRRHLRQLVRAVHGEREAGKRPRSYRALFRYLHQIEPI